MEDDSGSWAVDSMKNIKSIRLGIFLVLPTLVLLACCQQPVTPAPSGKGEPLEVTLDKTWHLGWDGGSNLKPTVYGNILYAPQYDSQGLIALDMDTGTVFWKKSGLFIPQTNPVRVKDKVYLQCRILESPGSTQWITCIAIFSESGDFLGFIKIGNLYTARTFYLDAHGDYLYWGTWVTQLEFSGLVRLDVVNGLTPDGQGNFTGTPETVYHTTDNVACHLVFDGNIAYYGTYPQEFTGEEKLWPHTLVALNIDTKQVLWTNPDGMMLTFWGDVFRVEGDLLYVLGNLGYGKYNKNTGAILCESAEMKAGDTGFSGLYNGKIYGAYPGLNEPVPNFNCANENTGKVLWSQTLDEGTTISCNPQVAHGIVYQQAFNKMYLMDADTGEILGYDSNLESDAYCMQTTFRYKDLMIVPSNDEIFAVKMNFHERLGPGWFLKHPEAVFE